MAAQRYFMELSYEGTHFSGWQVQPNAITVQGTIEDALQTVLKEKVLLVGCGRTDTGVHASHFVAHFDLLAPLAQSDLEKKALVFSLNGLLPPSIAVYSIYPVHDNFHARFSAISRTYCYLVATRKEPLQPFAAQITFPLDKKAMQQAASILLEYEDFTSFVKLHSGSKDNLCRISLAQWEDKDYLLCFSIRANRFLRNMVRAIVGTLIEVGRGKLSLSQFRHIIEAKDRSLAATSAPARGLCLQKVDYPPTK